MRISIELEERRKLNSYLQGIGVISNCDVTLSTNTGVVAPHRSDIPSGTTNPKDIDATWVFARWVLRKVPCHRLWQQCQDLPPTPISLTNFTMMQAQQAFHHLCFVGNALVLLIPHRGWFDGHPVQQPLER